MLTIPMVKAVETEEKKTLNHLKQKREYSLTTIEHFGGDKGYIIIRIVFLSIPTRPLGQVNGCDTALSMGSFSVIDCQTRPRQHYPTRSMHKQTNTPTSPSNTHTVSLTLFITPSLFISPGLYPFSFSLFFLFISPSIHFFPLLYSFNFCLSAGLSLTHIDKSSSITFSKWGIIRKQP